jgi:Gly-Xaa carboxypeptidase
MAPVKSKNYTLLPQGEIDPLTSSLSQQTRTRWNFQYLWKWALPGILAAVVILALIITQATKHNENDAPSPLPPPNQKACPQYPALLALSDDRKKLQDEVKDELSSDDFFDKSIKRVQGAVQIPTESFDDMGEVGEDERWDVFIPFQEYLKKTFPLV